MFLLNRKETQFVLLTDSIMLINRSELKFHIIIPNLFPKFFLRDFTESFKFSLQSNYLFFSSGDVVSK